LRREATANPKKAAILGLMALVAIYFWAPLVLKWTAKEKAVAKVDTPAASTGAVPIAALPTAEAAPTEAPRPKCPPWQQVVQWIQSDSRTASAPPLSNTRDPFQKPKTAAAETKVAEEGRPKPPVLTPAGVGLVLTGTIIGPQRRIARISGKSYNEGQTIEVIKDKLRVTFTLLEVHDRRAVLESQGERFDLVIPEPSKSSKMELLGNNGR